jgi:hypothetical protein
VLTVVNALDIKLDAWNVDALGSSWAVKETNALLYIYRAIVWLWNWPFYVTSAVFFYLFIYFLYQAVFNLIE